MPNWCENHMSFAGKKEELEKFLEVIKDDSSDCGYTLFEKLYPTPQELLDTKSSHSREDLTPQQQANKEKYGHIDWYDWRIANWGTKWAESDLRIQQEFHVSVHGIASIAFGYETAWGPAIELFDYVTEKFPNILMCLYYEEGGMEFCGKNIWANGSCVHKEEADLVQNYFDEDYLFNEHIAQ